MLLEAALCYTRKKWASMIENSKQCSMIQNKQAMKVILPFRRNTIGSFVRTGFFCWEREKFKRCMTGRWYLICEDDSSPVRWHRDHAASRSVECTLVGAHILDRLCSTLSISRKWSVWSWSNWNMWSWRKWSMRRCVRGWCWEMKDLSIKNKAQMKWEWWVDERFKSLKLINKILLLYVNIYILTVIKGKLLKTTNFKCKCITKTNYFSGIQVK